MSEPVDTPLGPITVDHFRPRAVRHRVVVGPKFLYAQFNPRDAMHPIARAFMRFVRDGELPFRRLLVNDHVVDEAATRLKKQASMRNATAFLSTLDESTLFRFEPITESAFTDGQATFVEWTDLDASFTDFLVAAHMDEMGVDHILTFDSHYEAFDVTTLPHAE